MNKITYPLKPRQRGDAVANLQEVLLYILKHRRNLLAPRPVMTHVSRPDWKKVESGLREERAKRYYGKMTKWLVANLQYHLDLPATGTVDEATAEAINALLEEWGLLENGEEEKQEFIVSGRVVSHELRGVEGLRVRVVDKNIGKDLPLGETRTGERGDYEIRYSPKKIRKGKRKPDVQVQALDQKGKILAASNVRYNAGPRESGLDVIIPEEKLPSPPELPRLQADLAPQLEVHAEQQLTRALAELKEDNERQDITYLANKTGWDARMVAMVALASRFSRESGIEPEFCYALFRAGVPANKGILSQMVPETVKKAWEQAIEQNILPPEIKKKIPENLKRFKVYATARLLEGPAPVGISGFGEVVKVALSEPEKQERLASLYYEYQHDLSLFWDKVKHEFGGEIADRLQLDGKVAFLTINNAPLIRCLHKRIDGLRDPLDLVRQGLFRKEKWEELLVGDKVPVPAEIPGDSPEEKRANYASFMANQLRLSYPTAVVSEMVKGGKIPIKPSVREAVTGFFDKHHGRFELGLHPVEQYLRRNDITLDEPVLTEIKKLQRVYQITPSDEAMGKLLEHHLDSAYAVVQYDEQSFIKTYEGELGGEAEARLIYHKAQQVHNAVLNIATSYMLEKAAPPLHSIPWKTMAGEGGANNTGILAYPTLEGLFGELDFCTCEHCRSWLSPAAYLVDLLLFLDKDEHPSPLDVLIERRPDIQHLQLTCENTNTVLPYIDLVNEVLEYWVVNGSLTNFEGHNIEEGVTIEELLASPQFVNERAYEILRDQVFPPPLPFHRSLEVMRRYFEHFEMPLHEAMEKLRKHDGADRDGALYGWRDILMERLGLSRQEYRILTNSDIPLQELYGEDPDVVTKFAKLRDELTTITVDDVERPIGIGNAKLFVRRLNLSYEELIDIVRTQFVNPYSHLIPKLENLHINFTTIQAFLQGTLSEADFEARLPEDLDPTAYGGDVKQWLRDHEAQIMGLIVLADPTGSEDICSFDTVELRYAQPDFDNNKLRSIEFLKLLRFIRLWKKLGWSIEQTDKAIKALYPADQLPIPEDDWDTARIKLDAGFWTLLDRLAHLQIVMKELHLKPNPNLLPLLACWSPIDTHGYDSLYRRMFLNPTILALDEIFQEDGYGNYLADKKEFQDPDAESPRLSQHVEALRAAFNLTGEEFELIRQELGFDENTILNLANISPIFRHGYLARKLRFSVRELLALKALSGLDPFLPLDMAQPRDPAQPFGAVRPPAIRFIELVQQIKNSPFKVSSLVYYLQHQDWSGEASPSQEDILAFARTLRGDLLRIEQENAVQEDSTGEVTKSRMALVYPQEAVDTFFGFLNNTVTFSTDYDHGRPQLEEAILEVSDRLTYDDLRKRLSFAGVMTEGERDALKGVPGVSENFKNAVQALYNAGQAALADFFARYPELESTYSSFVSSNEPVEKRFSALLSDILPDLLGRLRRQQVRQTVSAQVGADLTVVTPLLEDARVLHAVGNVDEPAIADFMTLETRGLSTDIFFAETPGTIPDWSGVVPEIDYGGSNPLPSDGASGVSGRWNGFLEASDTGFYNFYIEADAGAGIALRLDGQEVTLVPTDGLWHNQDHIELEAGRLYALELEAQGVKERLSLQWEHQGTGRVVIPSGQLYPATVLNRFKAAYLRVFKALAIAEAVGLSGEELIYFATHDDHRIDGRGWLNALPVKPLLAGATVHALLRILLVLLRYRDMKEDLNVSPERLLEVLRDPQARDEEGVLLLERVTGWREEDVTALLGHFGLELSDLSRIPHLARLHEAFGVVKKLAIGASTLLAVTTNDPETDTLRELQAALRARFDDTPEPGGSLPAIEEVPARSVLPISRDWLKLVQPINDELRSLRRDALVAYVLHKMGQKEATKHIDTPDKLFEYFLIDVEMDPCMKTSRIKQAISSVQLFTQRCLMNLEPQVASSDINAKQWEWMKRYRVWEANRKIFLWPENWLEPELRDNKSPFFRDLESELLQGDITDDAAAIALVHYLEKLDAVARLEICGMYYEENELGNPADDVVHVIARTAGTRRTYYYRRHEGGVTWTPWEKINLNIEDNPVLLVVWKDRLLLFWLSVLQQPISGINSAEAISSGTNSQNNSKDPKLTEATLSQLKGSAGESKMQVSLTLNWSEYYHGKWQAVRTSNLNKPLELGKFDALGNNTFDRTKLKLFSRLGKDGELIVSVNYDSIVSKNPKHFKLYNTHSLTMQSSSDDALGESDWLSSIIRPFRLFDDKNPPFTIEYYFALTQLFIQTLLKRGISCQPVDTQHPLKNIFEAPFFCQNSRHVFFVTTKKSSVLVATYPDIFVRPSSKSPLVEIPKVILPDYYRVEERAVDPVGPIIQWGDPRERTRIMADREATLIRVMAADGTIQYEGTQIGPHGGIFSAQKINK